MSMHHLHVSRSVSSVGLAHVVDDIVVHVLILVDVFVVGGITVGDLIGVVADVISFHLAELHEGLVDLLLVLGEVLDVLPPVAWSDIEVSDLGIDLEERVVERLVSLDVVSLWVGNEVTAADGVDVILLSEVAGALSPVDAAAVLVGDLIVVIGNLDEVSSSLVVHLSESWDSVWVGDPGVVVVIDGVDVVELEWALGPAGTIVLLALVGLPLIGSLLQFLFFLVILLLHLFWLWDLLLSWVELSERVLLSNEAVSWEVLVVEFNWAFGPADAVVLLAVVGEPLLFLSDILVADLSEVVSSWVCAVMSRFMVSAGSVGVHVLSSALKGEEVTWADNIINVVVSEEVLHVSRSISGVGRTVIVDDVVVPILILVDVLIISEITVGKFIGVSVELNEAGTVLLLVLHLVVEVLVDNVVPWVALVLEILVVDVVAVGDVVAGSHAALGVRSNGWVRHRVLEYPDGVVEVIIIHHSDGGVSLEPLVHETGIIDNIVVDIPLIEDLLVVHSVAVGELIRLPSDISLGLKILPSVHEASVTHNIIVLIINILDLLIVGFVSVGKTVRLSLEVDETLRSIDPLERIDFGS